AQLVEPASGAPLVERTLDTLLAALDTVGDDEGLPAGAVASLQRLAAVVAAEPVELRLALAPAILKPRELTLTRADAPAPRRRADQPLTPAFAGPTTS
ncbi:MAG: hypothetical protein M3467_07785, partial [Actinomycetota bacterium]|nr:hypothetical protein [Actinomycetota bacterium]